LAEPLTLEHGTPGGGDRTTDWASSNIRFRRHKGELQLWFTTQDNGFQIVRFTERIKALEKGLLGDRHDRDDDDREDND
jgi:hypothetical protein